MVSRFFLSSSPVHRFELLRHESVFCLVSLTLSCSVRVSVADLVEAVKTKRGLALKEKLQQRQSHVERGRRNSNIAVIVRHALFGPRSLPPYAQRIGDKRTEELGADHD